MDRKKITAHAGAQVFTGWAVMEAVLAVKCEQENQNDLGSQIPIVQT